MRVSNPQWSFAIAMILVTACTQPELKDSDDTLTIPERADGTLSLLTHEALVNGRVHEAALDGWTLYQSWTFALTDASTVELETLATASGPYLDTVLWLQRRESDGWGRPIAFDDDGGEWLWSRLVETLSAGTYRVIVRGYSAVDEGPFGLRMTCTGRGCGLQNADLDARLVSTLARRGAGLAGFVLPESDDFDAIPQDPRNPLSAARVELGRLLYHETGLATTSVREETRETYSCASCHRASAGFQAAAAQGVGEGGLGVTVRLPRADFADEELDIQPIRTPTAMNGAWQELMLWNGQFGGTGMNAGTEHAWTEETPKATNALGYEGLETQAIAGLGVHRLDPASASMLWTDETYRRLFEEAFPGVAEDERYDREHVGLAIAAFERTLISNRAPFQRWLRGEPVLADAELRGAVAFFDERTGGARCVNCHAGPSLATMSFHVLGMGDLEVDGELVRGDGPDDATRRGRGGFTGRSEDDFAFKTPSLYNLMDSPFYGHGATFNDLREVVVYFNRAQPQRSEIPATQLSPHFRPLGLSEDTIDDLTAFLETGLRDPSLDRYEPTALPSGLCVTAGDSVSVDEGTCGSD